ncbi:DegQ family serine endoprotease [Psychromonas sp. Urea-02u-13]|uniref:DegQ family serine endoprotease n=1 Tax=Psychromonas sp. Urea-02u-13 TaxID=2058326 RepID=UPI000C32266D|nr:DegQ family serine endoprotease [Psychromonas sp. Urea-02u-13]PKG39004.1 serine endoprotease DegQ [Psychromonas sp. Urea-02u-13]
MKKTLTHLVLLLSVLSFQQTASAALPFFSDDKPTLAPLIEKVSPAVVNISVSGNQHDQSSMDDLFEFFKQQRPDLPEQNFVGLGSGVIIDAKNGYIITNHHVIDNADEIKVELKSGKILNATIIGQDKQSDIALLKVDTSSNKKVKLTEIDFADSDKLRVGDFAIAIGNPFGLGQTVTSGIVSALGRSGLNLENLENFIQTDAAINSGNSGGALVNLEGQLIGINTAILGPNGGSIGIGFAIPANMIKNLVEQLIEHGEVRRGVLGVRGGEITPELATNFDLDSQHGAFVYQVNTGSAAEEAGIKAGDVIVAVNNKKIKSFAELRAKVGTLGSGKKMKLTIIRDGKQLTRTAVLKAPKQNAQKKLPQTTTLHPALSGAELTNTPNNKGVNITHIKANSMAERYGLQRADIIIGINKTDIKNLDELQKKLTSPPSMIALNIKRGDQTLYLILE